MVIAGVILGGAVAAWFALSHGKTEPSVVAIPPAVAPAPPAAATPPPPVPAPAQPAAEIPAPAVAPPAEAEASSAEQPSKRGQRGHKGKVPQVTAKHASPGEIPVAGPSATPVTKPAPPATPGELKPFPKL